MRPVRALGRGALGWLFVFAGADVVRNPHKPATTAGWLFESTRSVAPIPVPPDVHLVRANAAVQVAAGVALAAGFRPRAAAAMLIGSLVPTTIGGHAFWRHDDPVQRKLQRSQFTKNLGLLGGLLITADDRSDSPTTRSRRGVRA